MSKTPTFKIGDRVAYSFQWLKSAGMLHSEYAQGRGIVTAVKPLGSGALVSIDWQKGAGAPRVLAANLAHVGANRRFANC
jgi:hypothetical protein